MTSSQAPALLDVLAGERSSTRTRVALGLLAVVVALASAAALQLLVTPAFRPVDERSWVDYGWEVAGGDLPVIRDPLGSAPFGSPPAPHFQTAAHHPPLFPLLAGVALRVGDRLGLEDGAVLLTRLLCLAGLAVSAIALAGAVSELLPGRPRAWLGSVVVVTGFPAVTQLGAVVYSDVVALAAGLGATWAGLRVLRLGPTRWRLGATGAAVVACGLLRLSAVAVAAIPVALVVVGVAQHTWPAGRRAATTRALVAGVSLGAAVLVTSGWFYLRNLRLYDDVSGGAYLYELLGRRPRPLANIMTEAFWAKRYRTLWDGREFGTGEFASPGLVGLAWRYLWAWAAAAVVAVGLRASHLRRRPARVPTFPWSARLALVAGAGATVALVVSGLVDHVLDGGNGHVRYLLPGWWVPAAGVAAVLGVLGGRAAVALAGASWASLVVATLAVLDEAIVRSGLRGATGDGRWERLSSLVGTFALPGSVAVTATLVVLAGSLLVLPWALARLPDDLGRLPADAGGDG